MNQQDRFCIRKNKNSRNKVYEFQLTNRLNNAVQDICFRLRINKINRVLVKIGGMRKVNLDVMSCIFAALSKNTPAEGAMLSVMIIPISFKCYSCGKTWTTEDTEFLCPHCGSRNVDLLTGLETAIDYLEVES